MTMPLWIEVIGNILSHPIGQALTNQLNKLFESATPGDLNYVRFKITGQMPLEDENLYNLADAEFGKVSPNLARMHSARVGKLDSHMQDYYRLTMCGYRDETVPRDQDDRRRIDNMKKVMQRHALMSDPEWQAKIRINNLDKAKTDTLAEQIKKAVDKPWQAVKKVHADIDKDLKATGLPDGLNTLNNKLLGRIKQQLS